MNPYDILNLSRKVSDATIKKAYRKLSFKYHPDRNPGSEEARIKYQEIQDAYAILIDPERRQRYDQTGDTSQSRRTHENLSDYADIVIGAMFTALQQLGNFGEAAVKTADIIGKIKAHVRSQRTPMERQLDGMQTGIKALDAAMGRFRVKEDDNNFFNEALRSQRDQLQREITNLNNELDRFARALKFLDDCRYLSDIDKMGSSTTSSLLGGHIKMITWGST